MNNELGIYVHIPFCKRKCYYCDFISYTNKSENLIKKYVDELKREIQEYNFDKYNVTTIYIGGGTPSFINSNYVEDIFRCLKSKLKQDLKNMEITIEVNPGTVTEEKLNTYKQIGINRLSIGLQTTNNKLLKQIGRIHTFEDFEQTYELAKKVGFENINVDLILGLPNQTIQDLKESLERIIKFEPNHISVYSLIVEEGTKLEEEIQKGNMHLPSEELERNMYWYVKNTLELKGYKHYEISNFAKHGKESKHNMNCWEQKQYIGIGVAAHSYLNKERYCNTDDLEEYINNRNKIVNEKQSKQDEMKEYMLLGLRKLDGVHISDFKKKFVENPLYLFRMELNKLIDENLLEIDGDFIRLTNKGLDLANYVWEKFV